MQRRRPPAARCRPVTRRSDPATLSLAAAAVAAAAVVVAALPSSTGPPAMAGAKATRLVDGPLAFRLTGFEDAPSNTSLGDYRYAIVFKLNRDPKARLPNPEVPSDPGRVTRGDYFLRGYDATVSHLHRPKDAPDGARQCFVGYIDNSNPDVLREKLDPIRLGGRVRVTLRPLTPQPDGTMGYADPIRRRARLQSADVALEDKPARRLLRSIGC